MWVRSQNKKVLVASDYVEIIQLARSDNSYCDECQIVAKKNGEYITLGSYSTKEKAIKALDELQEMIDHQEEFKAQGENRHDDNSYIRMIKFVFQMPLDEDLEDET